MRKRLYQVGLGLSFMAVAVALGYLLLHRVPFEPRVTHRYGWQKRAQFEGEGAQRTEFFRVARAPWRLRWKVDGPPASTSIGLTVMPVAASMLPVFERGGIGDHSRGSTVMSDGGEFYIIVSADEGQWKLTIEVYERTGARLKPQAPFSFPERVQSRLKLRERLGLR